MPAVLIPPDVAERLREPLAALPGLEVIEAPLGEGAVLSPEEMERIEAAFFTTFSGPVAVRRILGAARRAPNLRWLHLGHSGTDDPIFQEMMDRGVTVTNSAGVQGETIAQSAIAGVLALNRNIPGWLEAKRRHAWEPTARTATPEELAPELRGQTMVIVGLGAIGQWVARFARPFGIHVVGVRRTPAGEEEVDEWGHPDSLPELLPRADILVLAVPLTAQTRGLIDGAALDRLPPRPLLINVARGAVVDEAALTERLRSGRIAGAYLDVFETEPLPEDSPLWDLPNVIISPHDAGHSAGTRGRVDAIFLEEVAGWLKGEPSRREVRDR